MRKITLSITLLAGLFILLLSPACKKDAGVMRPDQTKNSPPDSSPPINCSPASASLSLALKYLGNESSSLEETKNISLALTKLTFNEEECFNKMRYDKALEFASVDTLEVNYWREWSRQANEIAYRQTGKGFFASTEEEKEVVVSKIVISSSFNKRLGRTSSNAREASGSQVNCEPFIRNSDNVDVVGASEFEASRYQQIGAEYIGRATEDCDYVFRFTLKRINYSKGVFTYGSGLIFWGNPALQARIIEDHWDWNCGEYYHDILIGATKANLFNWGNPFDLALKLRMVIDEQCRFSSCYTGGPGTYQIWYEGKIYRDSDVITESPALYSQGEYPICQCEIYGKWYTK